MTFITLNVWIFPILSDAEEVDEYDKIELKVIITQFINNFQEI